MTDTNATSIKTIDTYELSIKAMNDTIGACNVTIDRLNKGDLTLKDAKTSLPLVTSQTANLPISIKEAVKSLDAVKTKKLYIDGLELVKSQSVNNIKLAMETIENIKEANKKPEKPELNQDELDRIAKEVKESIEQAMNSHFQAGKLLSEALELFKASGKPAKDWLEWANLSCQVKKAQAYNLVKIWGDFGQVSEFKGVSMRVLNILVHTSSDLFKKIEDDCKALAKAGKLDTKAVNKLLDTVKPAPVKVVPAETGKSNIIDKDNTGEAMKASIKSETPAIKDQNDPELETSIGEESSIDSTAKADSKESDKDKLIAELREQNLQLLARVEELTKAVQASKTETDAPARTVYLPQFDSTEAYLVLGISPVASKEEINKRYRTMAVIFNAKTCPAGAKALKNAKDELLKRCK